MSLDKETEKEAWKTIPCFSNYMASDKGRIRNSEKRILKSYSGTGVERISINDDNGKCKTVLVSRLVASAFIPNPESKCNVKHIDHDYLNNKLRNLEWASAQERNANHKPFKPTHDRKIGRCRPILRINMDGESDIHRFVSLNDAARWIMKRDEIGRTRCIASVIAHIEKACDGKTQSEYGFKWKFDTSHKVDTEGERWKTISCAVSSDLNAYKISDHGRIKDKNGDLIYGSTNTAGYIQVCILHKYYMLHRLVGMEFVENDDPLNKRWINHKDGNKSNQRADNLEWVTQTENVNHSFVTKLNSCERPVVRYDSNMNKIDEFCSASNASRELGIPKSTIHASMTIPGRYAKGHVFRYKNDIQ